jgi:hypothetical protein
MPFTSTRLRPYLPSSLTHSLTHSRPPAHSQANPRSFPCQTVPRPSRHGPQSSAAPPTLLPEHRRRSPELHHCCAVSPPGPATHTPIHTRFRHCLTQGAYWRRRAPESNAVPLGACRPPLGGRLRSVSRMHALADGIAACCAVPLHPFAPPGRFAFSLSESRVCGSARWWHPSPPAGLDRV